MVQVRSGHDRLSEWAAIHQEWLDEGSKLLNDAEAQARKTGLINVETVLKEGDIAHEIVAEAKKESRHYSNVHCSSFYY